MASVSSSTAAPAAPVLNTATRWLVIYPNYLDATKRISEGRRVPKAVAVENPTLPEIVAALATLNFQHLPEPTKCYPRDWLVEGRVRVDPTAVPNKQRLLGAVAEAIRASRVPAKAAQAAAASSSSSQAKKGKKKISCDERPVERPVEFTDPTDQSKWFVFAPQEFAVSATCPHYSAPLHLAPDQRSISCSRHDQTFDTHGNFIRGPCACDLPTRKAQVQGGRVVLSEIVASSPGQFGNLKDTTFAVLGGGAAAQAAISRLRSLGFPGRIVLFTEEARRPYDRTLLTKSAEEISDLVDEAVWKRLDVDLRLNTRVTAVDPASNTLTIGNSEKFPYTKCLIATGAYARTLPDVCDGDAEVFTVRRAEDVEILRKRISDKISDLSVVIVGSSFLGLEVAGTLSKSGVKKISVVSLDKFPLQDVVGPAIGATIGNFLSEAGVAFVGDSAVQKISSTGVELVGNRKISGNLVILAVGASATAPQIREISDLKVDAHGRVLLGDGSVSRNLFAAGDCVAGAPGHWNAAIAAGRRAAEAMLEEISDQQQEHKATGISAPFFWTSVMGRSLRVVGRTQGPLDFVAVEGEKESGNFLAFFVAHDEVQGVVGMGPIGEEMIPILSQFMNGSKKLKWRADLGNFPSPCEELKRRYERGAETTRE